MDNAALIGIHRLQGHIAPHAEAFLRHFPAERLQRLAAFLAVIADVERNAVIPGSAAVVRHEPGQVLQRIERFPAVADDEPDVSAGKRQHRAAFPPLYVDLHIRHTHAGKHGPQIFRGGLGGIVLEIGSHFGRAAAEDAESFFRGQLENLKFGFIRFHAQLPAGGLLGLLHGAACSNRFFHFRYLP